MFFGSSSPFQDPEQAQRQPIQILQADVIYEREKELKVSSLEGLRYLDKQYQKRITDIPYDNTVYTRFSVTHCEQTAEELFGHSELSQRLC